jgi:hypothetical protein
VLYYTLAKQTGFEMNERIGKLAVEAGAHWEHGDWNMPSAVYFSERDLEKFAELIVKECVSVINTEAAEHEDDDECERAWKMGTEFAVYQIKQHFGVEE